MLWMWLGVFLCCLPGLVVVGLLTWLQFELRRKYLDTLLRIFTERPLFQIPHGREWPAAEDVWFRTKDGLRLRGSYLRCYGERRGVILFGVEFGSNRWSAVPYCEALLRAGFDIFTFEPRNQGESDQDPSYQPLQWVTDRDLVDMKAAIAYLKKRPDADPRGIGIFGISKGGTAGLLAAAGDPWIRAIVSDGAFGTLSTMVPYMRKWFTIYEKRPYMQGLMPSWYYSLVAQAGIRRFEKRHNLRYPHLEAALPRLRKPWLLIHGGADSYIKPAMAEHLFSRARPPKFMWIVPDAKHNQALQVAPQEYSDRLVRFFGEFVAGMPDAPVPDSLPPLNDAPIDDVAALTT